MATSESDVEAFGFKWRRRDTFDSPASLARARAWLIERYGDIANAGWWSEYGDAPLLLDAGCGAAMSAIELLQDRLRAIRYLGVDASTSVDVARVRFAERGLTGAFLQADFTRLPLGPNSVDVILAEGVLHHTPSTSEALFRVAEHLRPGGRLLLYVYRRKGPIREFSDDYIRARLQAMTPEEAWAALVPLTKLGQALGRLHLTVDVPEPIDLLEIPAGPIDVQRLFYWHVFKAFFHDDLGLEELNHVNYDWYAPRDAHRQTPAELRDWCAEAGLTVDRERIEDAGISMIARKGDR
ncbi:MAG: class I SAM-dependent methyltransferase [Acidimicrobiia bacterium]|nr:class I SAM-dependent methyltransferase [Acidimicrobiia bacterium]